MGHLEHISFAGPSELFVPRLRRTFSLRTFAVFALVATLLLAFLPARAESVSQLHYSNYVNDFAHVLNDQTVSDLNDLCLQLDQKAHAQVAVVTINSLDGSDIESYSIALARQWGIGLGSKSTNRGVLILFAVKDHKYRFEVSYGLESILPDGKVGGFGREAVPLLKRGDYDGAVKLMTQRVANTIAQDAGVQLSGTASETPESDTTQKNISPAAIFWIILVIIIVLSSPLRKVLFWWLLLDAHPRWGGNRRGGWGNFGGGGWGGFGGGSFGGGGGFGGFGGGGGGGFGGGGASGGW